MIRCHKNVFLPLIYMKYDPKNFSLILRPLSDTLIQDSLVKVSITDAGTDGQTDRRTDHLKDMLCST